MAESNTTQGMFQQMGIDTRTQEQVLAQRGAARLAQRREEELARPEQWAGEKAFRTAGMQLGNALVEKYGAEEKLTPAEQANVDAMTSATTKFEEAKTRGDYLGADGKPDQMLEARGFERAIAGSLLKVGDPRGLELAKKIDQEDRVRRADDEARVKGGLEIEDAKRGATNDIYDFDRKVFLDKRGEIADIWVQGEQDPNAGFGVFIDDDGTASTVNGTEFPLGTYTTARPSRPPQGQQSGGPLDVKDYISLKNLGAMQAQHRGLVGQFNMAVAMADAISDGIGEDGTLEIMGSGGKVGAGVTRLLDNIQGLGRQIGSALEIEDKDGNKRTFTGSMGQAEKYARDNQDLFTDDMIPPAIRGDTRATQRYQAIIVQFAYGKARLNEENGRISDTDFKNAVQQIGANATDPEALRQVLVGDLNRAADNFNVWDKQMPPELRDTLIHPQARALYDEAFANFNQRFGQEFGTAARPGEGLTNPQGARRAGASVPGRIEPSGGSRSAELSQLEQELAELEQKNAERRAASELQ